MMLLLELLELLEGRKLLGKRARTPKRRKVRWIQRRRTRRRSGGPGWALRAS